MRPVTRRCDPTHGRAAFFQDIDPKLRELCRNTKTPSVCSPGEIGCEENVLHSPCAESGIATRRFPGRFSQGCQMPAPARQRTRPASQSVQFRSPAPLRSTMGQETVIFATVHTPEVFLTLSPLPSVTISQVRPNTNESLCRLQSFPDRVGVYGTILDLARRNKNRHPNLANRIVAFVCGRTAMCSIRNWGAVSAPPRRGRES
jgi:hypothetical protein